MIYADEVRSGILWNVRLLENAASIADKMTQWQDALWTQSPTVNMER
jgi:hypothetical protein